MAERVGFEPTCRFDPTRRFRGAPVATTSVPLRASFFNTIPSAPGSKKASKQGGALRFADAGRDADTMVEHAAFLLEAQGALGGPETGIAGTVDNLTDAGREGRAEAHEAGLERDREDGARQPVVTDRGRRLPDRHD